ncbi:hypothetical protein Peur_047139 [Populus x canadensis]
MNVEFSVATSGTDSIPTKPYNIVNRIGTSISTLYEKISFSDKVLGIRSPLSTRDKVNLTKNKLIKSRLRGIWKLTGDFELIDVDNGFFIVKFYVEDDMEKGY